MRLRANLPSAGRIGPHRFACHLRQGLDPGDTVQGRIVETGEPLKGGPRIVDRQETTQALYSPRHDYLIYYSAKSACTWLRSLFAFLHQEEARLPLDPHNLPPAFPLDSSALPSAALALVRDPAERLLSSFLDKVASWAYNPKISRARPILRWRFKADEARYSELTFLDFLTYLTECPYPGDEHFWPQPIYRPGVRIARVESLETDIRAFYADVRPALLEAVDGFLQQDRGIRNASHNTRLARKIERQGAETLGIGELATLLQSGTGLESTSFFSRRVCKRLDALIQTERDAYGYPSRQ